MALVLWCPSRNHPDFMRTEFLLARSLREGGLETWALFRSSERWLRDWFKELRLLLFRGECREERCMPMLSD